MDLASRLIEKRIILVFPTWLTRWRVAVHSGILRWAEGWGAGTCGLGQLSGFVGWQVLSLHISLELEGGTERGKRWRKWTTSFQPDDTRKRQKQKRETQQLEMSEEDRTGQEKSNKERAEEKRLPPPPAMIKCPCAENQKGLLCLPIICGSSFAPLAIWKI